MLVTRHVFENDGAVTDVNGGANCMTFRYTYNYVSLD
jgi:hypothetical protein